MQSRFPPLLFARVSRAARPRLASRLSRTPQPPQIQACCMPSIPSQWAWHASLLSCSFRCATACHLDSHLPVHTCTWRTPWLPLPLGVILKSVQACHRAAFFGFSNRTRTAPLSLSIGQSAQSDIIIYCLLIEERDSFTPMSTAWSRKKELKCIVNSINNIVTDTQAQCKHECSLSALRWAESL